MFGLNAATSLITPGSATQVLAAIASGLGFSRNTVEKNFYMNHTAPLLMAKMRALRKEKLNDIVRNLSRGIDDYPATLAIIDVLDYYNRGTMLGALQAISNDTAMQDIQAAGGKVIPPPMAKPVTEQIKDGTIAAQSGTFTKRPVRQATEAPHYIPDRPDDVAATASQVIKTINTKAVSVEQLNRFCDEADLLHPELPPTGTPSDLLDAAREQVTKKVREITGGPQIQKAATAAKNIFK